MRLLRFTTTLEGGERGMGILSLNNEDDWRYEITYHFVDENGNDAGHTGGEELFQTMPDAMQAIRQRIEHYVETSIENSVEYKAIKAFYGDKCTERSKVPLMNHIDEGVEFLTKMNASEDAKKAFCLHPIVQNYAETKQELPLSDLNDLFEQGANSIRLAFHYRAAANFYLCREFTDKMPYAMIAEICDKIEYEVVQMLYADKLQNLKDFNLYHRETHPRSKQLSDYFATWLYALEDRIIEEKGFTFDWES